MKATLYNPSNQINSMSKHIEICKRCGTDLTLDNWDKLWLSCDIRICNTCKDVWVIDSLRIDDPNYVFPPVPDGCNERDVRRQVSSRDLKYKTLDGKCSICGTWKYKTCRHHLWYPTNRYDPDSIIEVCPSCHSKIHNEHGSMPIV